MNNVKSNQLFGRALTLTAIVFSVLLLAACGSTKVYNNDKTVVYNGAVYNISKVKQIQSKVTGKLADESSVDLRGADRKQIEAYLDQGPMYVRMAFGLDDQEMLYRASSITKWSEYNSMRKSFENAGKQITSLMGNKKKMQLKLK
jgi:outer membrane murein-binding lipoprotein Lpp